MILLDMIQALGHNLDGNYSAAFITETTPPFLVRTRTIRHRQIHVVIHVISIVTVHVTITRIPAVPRVTSHGKTRGAVLLSLVGFETARNGHVIDYPVMLIIQIYAFPHNGQGFLADIIICRICPGT